MIDVHPQRALAPTRHEEVNARWPLWLPALVAAFYPFLLDTFHAGVVETDRVSLGGALLLLGTFLVPALGLYLAWRSQGRSAVQVRARRLGLLLVAVPTLYCFFGVNTYMLGSTVADRWFWTPMWLAITLLAWRLPLAEHPQASVRPVSPMLRVAHGISGVLVLVYIAFHLFNHLFSLLGQDAHAQVMEWGRQYYRAPWVEPLLVVALLFQVVTGLQLVWRWSANGGDFPRMFQLATGVFMAVFIIGHLNAVFIFARTFAGIETDWNFATADPVGMIRDPWSIRLLPHYALGVFFVLAHLGSGLRGVALAHGVSQGKANALLWLSCAAAALVSLAIMLGLTGTRIG